MLQLIYLQCIIKVRGAPIDGCPGEKLNELFEKPPFSSAKSIGGFSMRNNKAPTKISRRGFVLPTGNNRYACHTAHPLSDKVYHK